MRTVLAAAAAGALILGSAGGSVAAPDTAPGPKAKNSAEATTKLQTVNIKGPKKIDLAMVDGEAEGVTLNLRAKVRYTKKTMTDDTLDSFGVDLAFFGKKVNAGDPLGDAVPGSVMLKTTKTSKNKFYAGSAVVSMGDLDAAVVDGEGKAYVCISAVAEPEGFTFDKYSQQTRKRLGKNAQGETIAPKKTVRDCVKVVNSAATTDDTDESTS